MIQTTGSYQVPFLASAALLAIGIVGALFIDRCVKVGEVGDPPGVLKAPSPHHRTDTIITRL
ncbi:MAG: hypothetical protein ACR2GP_00835 [Burkholderiaceae bacterium]